MRLPLQSQSINRMHSFANMSQKNVLPSQFQIVRVKDRPEFQWRLCWEEDVCTEEGTDPETGLPILPICHTETVCGPTRRQAKLFENQ
jgi:hypothetical protein